MCFQSDITDYGWLLSNHFQAIYRLFLNRPMCTVVATPTLVSLDDHFIKRPSATFFVIVEGGIALTLTLAVAQALGVWAVKNSMIHRLQYLLCPAVFTQQTHIQRFRKDAFNVWESASATA